jgi:hypothetical protein
VQSCLAEGDLQRTRVLHLLLWLLLPLGTLSPASCAACLSTADVTAAPAECQVPANMCIKHRHSVSCNVLKNITCITQAFTSVPSILSHDYTGERA